MLRDYRSWLKSELALLGNATHHAYSLGQANMAKRALEEFDRELAGGLAVVLAPDIVQHAIEELTVLGGRDGAVPPALAAVRAALDAAGTEPETS